TEAQADALLKSHSGLARRADHFDKIELHNTTFDTTVGEPAIPAYLKEQSAGNKRLRIVQFQGPVLPEWLEQLKSLGGVKLVHYVPNNAYTVLLDAGAEAKLQKLRVPDGPIQWVGVFHPYYKVKESLLQSKKPLV